MRHAAGEVLGREISREVLMANVGQPLPHQMELLSAEHAEALLDSYRLHNEKNHDALIEEFPGVEEALGRLSAAGIEVAVVTSKRRFSRSEEHTSELQSRQYLVCRLLLEKKKK